MGEIIDHGDGRRLIQLSVYESGKEFAYETKSKTRPHTLISAWPKRDNKHVLLFNFAV